MARIGIDLGTTNSLAALVYDDGPAVVPRGASAPHLIPSVVKLLPGGGDVVGEAADNAGSERVVRSVKRLMGRTYDVAVGREQAGQYFAHEGSPGFSDASVRLVRRTGQDLGVELRDIGGGHAETFWPSEISARVLQAVRLHAESQLGRAVSGAVVTVPAYFGNAHRAATLEATRQAGLTLEAPLLDEPTAGALAFARQLGFRAGEPVLVVDWGGGTFDLSVLVSDGREWTQLAIDGDLCLGGDDVDRALAAEVLRRCGHDERLLDDDLARHALLRAARATKHELSRVETALFAPSQVILDPATDRPLPPLNTRLTRQDLEQLARPLLDRIAAIVERTLERPEVDRGHLRHVLLVGGATQIPAFRARIATLLAGVPLHDEVDPLAAVALGAAIYAHPERPAVARIAAHSYVVVDERGTVREVIPADAEVPTPEAQPYCIAVKTSYAEQSVYRLRMSELERGGVGTPLRIFAHQMPRSPEGTPVEVRLWLDADKQLVSRCQVGRLAEELPLESGELGLAALWTELLDAELEAAAVVDANPGTRQPLVNDVSSAVELARRARASRDRPGGQHALDRMRDLADQVQAKQEEGSLPPERHAFAWLLFYRDDMFPRFRDLLPVALRERVAQRLSQALQACASQRPDAASLREQLESDLFRGDPGCVFSAWRQGDVLGVSGGTRARLRELADRAAGYLRAGDAAGFASARAELQTAVAQSQETWRRWRASGEVAAPAPDLIVRGESG